MRTKQVERLASVTPLPGYNSNVSASAQIILPKKQLTPKYETWQDESWGFYDTVGEFAYGVGWLANVLSRVRLLVAELSPGGDEPEPMEGGPANEALARLSGGTGGQAQLMKQYATHLGVAGECWLLGEVPDDPRAEETWNVKSADELRVSRRKVNGFGTYEIKEGDTDTAWRLLNPESLVVRCWRAHPRWSWRSDAPAKHALGALFEIDIINKRIIATMLSRLASNGILLYDKTRLSVPTRTNPPGPDDVDPFAQVLVEVASRGIADPASPEATIPIPIGFQIDDLTNVNPQMLMQLISFGNPVDEKLLAARDSAIKRLAISMDLPAELLLGMDSMNHWGAFQIEESAIKIHVVPTAELICHSLTVGYLIPMLEAQGAELVGPNGGKLVIWYDPSEIVIRPDKSANTILAYDRLEASGEALRRETGIDESDKPDPAELADQALKVLMRTNPALAASALQHMGGPKLEATQQAGGVGVKSISINRPGTPAPPVDSAPATDPNAEPPDSGTPPTGSPGGPAAAPAGP